MIRIGAWSLGFTTIFISARLGLFGHNKKFPCGLNDEEVQKARLCYSYHVHPLYDEHNFTPTIMSNISSWHWNGYIKSRGLSIRPTKVYINNGEIEPYSIYYHYGRFDWDSLSWKHM